MASFDKAKKSYQKNHKERSQVKGRERLGLLEKHKDYVLRAKDYHSKRKRIKLLRDKALNKNPDEFYFKMVRTKTKEGVHIGEKPKQYTAAQLKMMKTQDLNYVNLKRSTEMKKIEKLNSSLHLAGVGTSDSEPMNQHIVFVDSRDEEKEFDAANYFNTAPELVSRTFNRPTMETLQNMVSPSDNELGKIEKQRNRMYEELRQRIEREDAMKNVAHQLQIQKHLMGKGPCRKIKDKTDDKPAVFKWKKQRKR